MDKRIPATNSAPILYEGALASFLNSALGFSPTLFLQFLNPINFLIGQYQTPIIFLLQTGAYEIPYDSVVDEHPERRHNLLYQLKQA